jgi:hypothetical protein
VLFVYGAQSVSAAHSFSPPERLREHLGQPLEISHLVDPAARVVRVVEDDEARAGRDPGSDRLDVETKGGRPKADTNRHAVGGQDEHLVEEPGRREEDRLVPRFEKRPQGDCQGGETAVGHGHVRGIPLEPARCDRVRATARCDVGSFSL